MNPIASVYEYENEKVGLCTLISHNKLRNSHNAQANFIYPNLKEKELTKIINILKLESEFCEPHCLGASIFTEQTSTKIRLNTIDAFRQGNKIGTDLMRQIAMFANKSGQNNVSVYPSENAIDFYKKLGFAKDFFYDTMTADIKTSKFADFSQFEQNEKLSNIATEILNS